MKIPLLLHAPTKIDSGPTVMLSKGSWRIESNLVDSIGRLHLGSHALVDFVMLPEFDIENDIAATVSIIKSGTEKQLTVFAVKVK